MSEYAAQGQIGANMVVRDKNWNERNSDERLEALREQVTWLTYRLAEAEQMVAKLRHHQHSPSGEIVVYLERVTDRIVPHELRVPNSLRDDFPVKR